MDPSNGLSNGLLASTGGNLIPNGMAGMSADEFALYDRQIRLWGVQSQERLRTSNILLIGLKALGTEIAKNLVLTGIGSLTIVDDDPVTENDLGAQFFVSEEHIGQIHSQAALTQIQELNPRVNLLTANFGTLLADHVFFGVYSLVIATDLPLNILTQLNVSCRMQSRPFYAAGSFGFYGFIFTDLIQHTYIISREKSNIETKLGPETPTRSIIDVTSSRGSDGKTTEQVTKTETYTPINLANTSRLTPWHLANRRRKFLVSPILSCIRALWDYQATTGNVELSHTAADLAHFTRLANEKHKELSLPPETLRSDIVKSFVQGIGSEIGSVCACLGARLAEDVINVVGGKEQPIQNFVVFDGDETKAQIYALHTDMNMTLRNGNGVPLTDLASVPYTNGSSALNVGSTSQHARTISNGSINMNMPV